MKLWWRWVLRLVATRITVSIDQILQLTRKTELVPLLSSLAVHLGQKCPALEERPVVGDPKLGDRVDQDRDQSIGAPLDAARLRGRDVG